LGRHPDGVPQDPAVHSRARQNRVPGRRAHYDAVLRNLEVIGEAVKNLPEDARSCAPGIEWKKIAGLRDVIAHGYFGVDDEILWSIVRDKVPELLTAMEAADPPE
jgi:uncharacterized protein with HEPN domain